MAPCVYMHVCTHTHTRVHLTICGSLERLTQPEMSLRVSLFTVRMLLIRGCFVTISPVCTHTKRHQTQASSQK